MKTKPLGDRVLVEVSESGETKTAGGMILSDSAKTHKSGTVVATGPGIYTQNGNLVTLTVKPGDTVHFVPNTGQEVNIDGNKYMLCREGDLIMYDAE